MRLSLSNQDSVGIIAGGGQVPAEIANAIVSRGECVYVLAINENISRDLLAYPCNFISLGQISRMLRLLRQNRCKRIIIAGYLKRPDLSKVRVDLGFFFHFCSILSFLRGGDDYVLSRVVRFFERKGFVVVGIPALAPELIIKEGLLTGQDLAGNEIEDVCFGYELLQKLGQFDIGQAIVVRNRKIIAIEGVDGTDAMLCRLARSIEEGSVNTGILVKATKPGQELRIDLPTIGTATVAACNKSGIKTIALEAQNTIIAEREKTISLANTVGVSILGFPAIQDRLNEIDNTIIQAKELTCLTSCVANAQHLADACKVLMAMRIISTHTLKPSMIIARHHILSINLEEPLELFIVRARTQLQWGDAIKKKKLKLLAISSHAEITTTLLHVLAANNFAGIVINYGTYVSTEFLKIANHLRLFILVHA
ncbi:MAG: hypothetical protein TECD_00328 [Hyphomicrobiaceae bacterium hypho_1]